MKKMFVLDTNVILHDYKSIYSFDEHDVVIPIVVLEELDKFKKGSDLINFHAREFMRLLDSLVGDFLFTEGISLGINKGMFYIETGKEFSYEMQKSFSEKSADHRILAITEYLHQKKLDRKVILVTQDINFRMKAKSLGIQSEDYQTGKIANVDQFDLSIQTVDKCDSEAIAQFYKSNEGVEVSKFSNFTPPKQNGFYILKNEKSSALAFYDREKLLFHRIEKQRCFGIAPRNAEQTFALDALLRPEIKLVSLTGKAGTGKTLLALAAALHQHKNFQQIFLARPIVPLANRDMGFLPGDVKDKIGPYMQPLFDNLSVIKHKYKSNSFEYQKIEEMLKEEQLLISPLAYIRGRSLTNVFFIVDEAQNLTPHEIKTIITRAGENTKMVFTGDIQQIDSPYLDSKSNGLSYLTDKMAGQDIFSHVQLVKGERSFLADLASDLL